MPAYLAGATVERRYPGPDGDAARRGAEPQVQAFLASGWMISGERWEADEEHGAPIGDAIAAGSASYLAGDGGELVVTYTAARDTDLPADLPAYALVNPRTEKLATIATVRIVVGLVVGFLLLLFVAQYAGQMGEMIPFVGGPPEGPVFGAPEATFLVESPAP